MQLLANLLQRVRNIINFKKDGKYLWTDSSTALNWINSQPGLFKTFVSNHIADIQSKSDVKNWYHIRSRDNPADALSRGQLPHEFIENRTWFHGSSWLKQDVSCWPQSRIPGVDNLPEKHKASCLVVKSDTEYINLHTGAQNTLHSIREILWPVGGQNQIKRVIRNVLLVLRPNLIY